MPTMCARVCLHVSTERLGVLPWVCVCQCMGVTTSVLHFSLCISFVWVDFWERVHVCIVVVLYMYTGEGMDTHGCVSGVYVCKFV